MIPIASALTISVAGIISICNTNDKTPSIPPDIPATIGKYLLSINTLNISVIISGLAATGSNEIIKQIKKKEGKENEK